MDALLFEVEESGDDGSDALLSIVSPDSLTGVAAVAQQRRSAGLPSKQGLAAACSHRLCSGPAESVRNRDS
jgi:hypothetical protein